MWPKYQHWSKYQELNEPRGPLPEEEQSKHINMGQWVMLIIMTLYVVFKSCSCGRKHISIGHSLDENNNKMPGIKSSSDNDHNASNSYKKKNWSPKEYQN